MKENPVNQIKRQERRYWARVGFSVKEGIRIHQASGHLTKHSESLKRAWGNVTEHCLVEVNRAEVLGRWVGLPDDLISDIKIAAVLHDFYKKQEITATRQANENRTSPLAAVRSEQKEAEKMLRTAGFSSRVIRLASSPGEDASQLIETKRILNQENLSDEDLAYLVCHYVDDCSVGSDWVRPSYTDGDGHRVNIIDYRAEENKSKPTYGKISEEIREELKGSPFEGMNNHDVMALVSHQIEQRLVQRIKDRTGEVVDPLAIPELVDQKIRKDIEQI